MAWKIQSGRGFELVSFWAQQYDAGESRASQRRARERRAGQTQVTEEHGRHKAGQGRPTQGNIGVVRTLEKKMSNSDN